MWQCCARQIKSKIPSFDHFQIHNQPLCLSLNFEIHSSILTHGFNLMSTPFEHLPLDGADPRAFRVLELLPSYNLEGVIHCKLNHRTLDNDLYYEALSYTWGDPNPKTTIYINGSNTLGVTRNCYQALFHLRQRYHPRILWIDAICIDQRENESSTQERNHQVKFMSDIYAKAETVLIWLGCAEHDSLRTLTRLKLLGMTLRAARRLGAYPDDEWSWRREKTIRNPVRAESISNSSLITRLKHSALDSFTKVLLDNMSECISPARLRIFELREVCQ